MCCAIIPYKSFVASAYLVLPCTLTKQTAILKKMALFCNRDNDTVGNGPRTAEVSSRWPQKPLRIWLPAFVSRPVPFNRCPSFAKKVRNPVTTFSPFPSQVSDCSSLAHAGTCSQSCYCLKLSPNIGRLPCLLTDGGSGGGRCSV